jgi:hypothetical protein
MYVQMIFVQSAALCVSLDVDVLMARPACAEDACNPILVALGCALYVVQVMHSASETALSDHDELYKLFT